MLFKGFEKLRKLSKYDIYIYKRNIRRCYMN